MTTPDRGNFMPDAERRAEMRGWFGEVETQLGRATAVMHDGTSSPTRFDEAALSDAERHFDLGFASLARAVAG